MIFETLEAMFERRRDARFLVERATRQPLRLQAFTALFGCTNYTAVQPLLEAQDRTQPYSDIYGLHNLRWMLFDGNQKNGTTTAQVPALPRALVLCFVCDGNSLEVLSALLEHNHAQFSELLQHCHGFAANTDLREFVLAHTIPNGYFFRDLGPMDKFEGWKLEADPTRVEIKDAYDRQGEFETFYEANAALAPAALRRAFLAQFGAHGFEWPLTRFERAVPGEQQALRRFMDTARKEQDQQARKARDHKVRRPIHAKGHGLLFGKFHVESGVNSLYRVGLFEKPGSYDVILRPSSGKGSVASDRGADAHGLALRVLLPSQAHARRRWRLLAETEDADLRGQDFVLIDNPVFFAANIVDLAELFAIQRSAGWPRIAALASFLLRQPDTFRHTKIFIQTFGRKPKHPFASSFHSTTPYALGHDCIVQYSVQPRDPERFQAFDDSTDPDFLQKRLAESLRERPIELDFFIHALSPRTVPTGFRSLTDIVEDATLDWAELHAHTERVATIVIGPQDPIAREQLELSERIRFNPWHALEEHRPLGSLNRGRLAAYRASQEHRAQHTFESGQTPIPNAAE